MEACGGGSGCGYCRGGNEASTSEEGTAYQWRLKWQKAREEAQRLVDRMQFKNAEISEKRVDISPIMLNCTAEGELKEIIAQAVARILRSRGAIVDPVKRE
jgi:hypothetical protein